MKTIAILALAILPLMAACAPKLWYHQTKGAQDFNVDKYQCDNEASLWAASNGMAGNIFAVASRMDTCLRVRGWGTEAPTR